MKGISPLIAAVLLIGFTVAVGGIIGIWLTSLTKTQTSTVEDFGEKQAKCAGSTLTIKEAKYNMSSTFVNVTLTYETGTERLFNLTVEVSSGGATTQSIPAYNISSDPFEPGESYAVAVSVAGMQLPPDYVRARAYCQDVIGIIGECKSGQSCMKQV